jgi:peptide/nickel transport system substrate-binding protein
MTEAAPRRGGTLTMVLSADPPGLDPVQLQGVQNWAEAIAAPAIYDALLQADGGKLQPKLAMSLTSPDGGRTWLLALRPGVVFSDGAPLDAEAVRQTWARLADPGNRSPVARHAGLIARMEATDPLTLRITLQAPTLLFDRLVARYLSSIGSPAAPEGAPVGAGPFVLAEWERGSHMRFTRNPRYWQAGKPRLDEFVVLTGMADAAPKYEAVTSGRAQIALEPLGVNVGKYRKQPERYAVLSTPETGGGVALALNLAKPPFDDRRLRRALALALDSADYVERVAYDDPAMVMTTLDREGTRWCDPGLRLPARDLAAAQRLIDEIAAEQGGLVRFTVETFANDGHIREANVVKQIVESCLTDIEVDVSVGTVAEVMGKWRSGDWHASNHAVRWSDPALDLPASFASNSPANIMGYSNAEVDEALERLARTTDEAEALAAHHAVLRRVLEDLPVIFLSHKEAFHIVDRDRVRDWKLLYSLRPLIEEAWAI